MIIPKLPISKALFIIFRQKNIMDQMMDIMEKYANNLEDLVTQRTNEVYEEKRKTEDLLHRMLPAYVHCSSDVFNNFSF